MGRHTHGAPCRMRRIGGGIQRSAAADGLQSEGSEKEESCASGRILTFLYDFNNTPHMKKETAVKIVAVFIVLLFIGTAVFVAVSSALK